MTPHAHHLVRDASGAVLGYTPGTRFLVTDETVVEMERWAKAEQDHPLVREWAIDACSSVDDCRSPGEAAATAIVRVVRKRVRYVQGPFNVQLIHAPGFLVSMGRPSGNCVDMTTLACAMALSVGLSPSIVRVAFSGEGGPDPYEHVIAVIECRGLDGQSATVVLDATVPESEAVPLLRRATTTYVHDPVGRPAVQATGPIVKEALTVVHALNAAPSFIDGKANRCPCGSGRLAGSHGCSLCSCEEPDPQLGGAMAIPRAGGIGGEIAADLAGMLDRPLSSLLAYVNDASEHVLRACSGRHAEDQFAWIHDCQNAASAVASMILMVEQNTNAYRSPEAKQAIAANIHNVLPVESLIEWSQAALEALSAAARACNLGGAAMQGCGPPSPGGMAWGNPDPFGRTGRMAGAMGAASIGARLAEALFPGDGNARAIAGPVLEAAGAGICNVADLGPLVDGLNAVLGVLGKRVSVDEVRAACVTAAAGPGLTNAGQGIMTRDVPESIRGLLTNAEAPFAPDAGPFEGSWAITTTGGDTITLRLYDRQGWVLGPVMSVAGPHPFRGDFAGRRAGPTVDGRFHSYGTEYFVGWIFTADGDQLTGAAPGTSTTAIGTLTAGPSRPDEGWTRGPGGAQASGGGSGALLLAAVAGIAALAAASS